MDRPHSAGDRAADGLSLSWLWEYRPHEVVPPAPLSSRPRQEPRQAPAWDELANALGQPSLSSLSRPVTPAVPSRPSSRFAGSRAATATPSRGRASPVPRHWTATPCGSSAVGDACTGNAFASGLPKDKDLRRPASRITLAKLDATSAGLPGTLCRGIGIKDSLAERRYQLAELANYQLEQRRMRAAQDRCMAAQRMQKKRLQPRQANVSQQAEELDAREDDGAPKHSRSSVHESKSTSMPATDGRRSTISRVRFSVNIDPLDAAILDVVTMNNNTSRMKKERESLGTRWMSEGRESHTTDGKLAVENDDGFDEPLSEVASLAERSDDDGDKVESDEEAGRDVESADTENDVEDESERDPKKTGEEEDSKIARKNSLEEIRRRRTLENLQVHGLVTVAEEANVSVPTKNCNNQRLRRLLQARRREFDQRPADQRERLRHAFAAGDIDGQAHLDHFGLHAALEHLGLHGRSKEERKAVNMLLHEATVTCGTVNFFDFVYLLVPKVELRLNEIWAPELSSEFEALDTTGIGCLKAPCVLRALELKAQEGVRNWDVKTVRDFWAHYVDDFNTLFAQNQFLARPNTVNFIGFQNLVSGMLQRRTEYLDRVERQLSRLAELPIQIEKAHYGELAFLMRMFLSEPALKVQEAVLLNRLPMMYMQSILLAILNSGVAPTVGVGFKRATNVMAQFDENATIPFSEFLRLVARLRDEQRVWVTHALSVFFDTKGSRFLRDDIEKEYTCSDVPHLIRELDLCNDCMQSDDELKALAETLVDNVDEQFSSSQLIDHLLKVIEKARFGTRGRENQIAKELGLSDKDMFRLRHAFAELTDTGAVGLVELRSLITYMHPKARPVDAQIEAAVNEIVHKNIVNSFSKKHGEDQDVDGAMSVGDWRKTRHREGHSHVHGRRSSRDEAMQRGHHRQAIVPPTPAGREADAKGSKVKLPSSGTVSQGKVPMEEQGGGNVSSLRFEGFLRFAALIDFSH